MWVMFLIVSSLGDTTRVREPNSVHTITQEFTSKATCVNAVTEAKKSKKTYSAWCVQK